MTYYFSLLFSMIRVPPVGSVLTLENLPMTDKI